MGANGEDAGGTQTFAPEVEEVLAELREEFPERADQIARYVGGKTFGSLSSDKKRREALLIFRGALRDARRKAAH